MGPIQAVKTCFRKYFVFSSRASRSEYWWWTLFVMLGAAVTTALDVMIFGFDESGREFATAGVVDGIFSIATIVPHLAVSVRRLHDANWSGWWVLALLILSLAFIPLVFVDAVGDPDVLLVLLLVCALVWTVLVLTLLVRMCMRGDEGTNRFGPNPLTAAPGPGTGHRHEV